MFGKDILKKEDLWEINYFLFYLIVMFLQDLFCVQDNVDLILVIERFVIFCEKVCEKIKCQFFSYILIICVREILIEEIFMFDMNICMQFFIFLFYIRRFYGYRGWYNVYLQVSLNYRG